jgi:type IV secretory pathway TraG/TraD family ATPase VirD4
MSLPTTAAPHDPLAFAQAISFAHEHGVFLGQSRDGLVFAPAQHGVLVLGPPRAGKTTSIVLPNLFCANGSVLAISTKPDLLDTTLQARSRLGPVLLFDPSGSVARDAAVTVGWSPLGSAHAWDQAVLTAEAMVGATHRNAAGDQGHWNERAGALLATLFHAGALMHLSMAEIVRAVNRRQASEFITELGRAASYLAHDLLVGITETDSREQSGIWSTASGVLSAYRTESALASTTLDPFDAEAFVRSRQTLYICATGDTQTHVGPLIVGLIRDLRTAAYRFAARRPPSGEHRPRPHPPVLLILDELANIAPIHDLPTLIAEGGSQGLVAIACLQDLSQARARWGIAADGFFSLFGAKVVLPGIGDTRTLEAISLLAGDVDVTTRSVSRGPRHRLFGSRRTASVSSRRQRRLPPDAIAIPRAGQATLLLGAKVSAISLTPAFASPLFAPLLSRTEAETDLGRAAVEVDHHAPPAGKAIGRT